MSLFERTKCPYCNKKVNLITTWVIKREGEYRCPRCRGISNIILDLRLIYLAVGAVATSTILFLIIKVLFKVDKLFALMFIILPIILFYLASLFMVKLKKPVKKKKKRVQNSSRNSYGSGYVQNKLQNKDNVSAASEKWNGNYNIEQTKIM